MTKTNLILLLLALLTGGVISYTIFGGNSKELTMLQHELAVAKSRSDSLNSVADRASTEARENLHQFRQLEDSLKSEIRDYENAQQTLENQLEVEQNKLDLAVEGMPEIQRLLDMERRVWEDRILNLNSTIITWERLNRELTEALEKQILATEAERKARFAANRRAETAEALVEKTEGQVNKWKTITVVVTIVTFGLNLIF